MLTIKISGLTDHEARAVSGWLEESGLDELEDWLDMRNVARLKFSTPNDQGAAGTTEIGIAVKRRNGSNCVGMADGQRGETI